MKQQKTELMELFETHLNRTTDKWERSGLKSFRQKSFFKSMFSVENRKTLDNKYKEVNILGLNFEIKIK